MDERPTLMCETAPTSRRSFLALGAAVFSGGCQAGWGAGGGRSKTVAVDCDTSTEWAQFQADAANSGEGSQLLPSLDEELSLFGTITDRSGGIVVDAAQRVFASDQQAVRAFDAREGSELWRRTFDSLVATTPVLVCGTLVVQTSVKTYALDAEDGEIRWEASPGNQFADPVLDGQRVYVASGVPTALDIRDGSTVWDENLGDVSPWGCCLADRTLVVAGQSGDGGALVGLDAASGTRQWRKDVDRPVKASPTYSDGTVYVPDMWGDVYALSPGTGEIEWQTTVYEGLPAGRRAPTPTVADETVVVPGGNAHRSVGLDAASGTQQWELETGPTLAPALRSEDGVVLGTVNDGVFLVTADGTLADQQTDARVASQMALTDDGLFFKSYGRDIELAHLQS